MIDSLAPGGFCQSAARARSGVHVCVLARVALPLRRPAAAHHGAAAGVLQAAVMGQPAHTVRRREDELLTRLNVPAQVCCQQVAIADTGRVKVPLSCCLPPAA